MPGIPSVYYGSEYGIKAVKGKNTDLPLRPELDIDSLKDADKKLFKLICSLGEIRSKSEAIKHGTYNPIIIKNEQLETKLKTILEKYSEAGPFDDKDTLCEVLIIFPFSLYTTSKLILSVAF